MTTRNTHSRPWKNRVNESTPRNVHYHRGTFATVAVFLVLSTFPTLGQNLPTAEDSLKTVATGFPTTVAVPVTGAAPLLDGDVLGDLAWMDIPAATGFVQTQPDEGQPVTERTEVRVLFDDEMVYFGFICYDRDPDGIITSESRRDSSLNNSDSIRIVLDTFHDRQSAFVFGTSPAGQEYDGQVMNEGQGGGGFNVN